MSNSIETLIKIYKITNKNNGKIYVGQTIQTLKKRLRGHIDNNKITKSPTEIGKAILTEGIYNFEMCLIEFCSPEEADLKEKYWITYYNAYYPSGYNIREGGKNGRISEITKAKLRGRAVSAETRRKLAISRAGVEPSQKALQSLELGRLPKTNEHKIKWCRGENNANDKLTEEEVVKIRKLYATGRYTQEVLGDMFNVTQMNISAITRRKTWNHIPAELKLAA